MAINERIGNKAGAAKNCNQLGIVAKGAGRPAEAEHWYRRAITLGEDLNDIGGLVKWYSNLADLLLTPYDSPFGPRPDLDAAIVYKWKALAIKNQLYLSSQP